MSIAKCPKCKAALEIPDHVPGGYVACPWCKTEFAVNEEANRSSGKGRAGTGRPKAGRAAAGRSAGTRAGGRAATTRARRGRGREVEDEEEDAGRRGARRKKDLTPFVVIGVSAVILVGVLVFFLVNKGRKDDLRREEELAAIASKAPAHFDLPAVLGSPSISPLDIELKLHEGARITIQKIVYNLSLNHMPHTGKKESLYSLNYSIETGEEGAEKVTGVSEDITSIEGTYRIKGWYEGATAVVAPDTRVGLRYQLDSTGVLVPQSLKILDGAVPAIPAYLPDRSFTLLQKEDVRNEQYFGRERLPNPFLGKLDIGGTRIDQIPLIDGGRQGGWYVSGGQLLKEADGTWARESDAAFKLFAIENRHLKNGRFAGEPADITVAIWWHGDAIYKLPKGCLYSASLKVELHVVAKLPTSWHEWTGSAQAELALYKDP